MSLLTDERAQAIQIGAVLIFGILIIFLSLYQAFVVPDQNEEIEFNHNEELQQQMTELRSNVILMPGSTTTRAASVDLGVRYPSRAIFVNPGPASGTLRTVGTDTPEVNVTITNATAVEDAGETRDFWNGTGLSYDTGALEYQPGYNLYHGAPRTVYEYSVLYNSFDGGAQTLPVTGQTLVDGNRITLVALNGSLTENRVDTLSLDVDPISTRTRVVELNGTGKPVTLQLATGMSEAEWNATFGEELVANGGHVQDVSVSADGHGDLGLLEVTLEAGQRYQLELAKVGVGTGATGTDAEYLTDVEGNGSTLESGETVQLTVEARDRFNGPESGVTVTAEPSGGNFTGGHLEKVTDTEGQATYEYEADSPGTHPINFTIDPGYNPDESFEAGSPRNVSKQVTVESPPSGGGGSGVAYNSSWILPSGDGIKCEDGTCVFDQNRSDSDELELTMETDPTADDANVEFAVNDTETASINSSSTDDRTSADGTASVTLTPLQDGSINAYTWSGGSGDTLPITFVNVSEEPFFDVNIMGTNSPVREGETLTVDVNVTNTGTQTDTQTLNLTDTGFSNAEQDTVTVTLAGGESDDSITLEWATSDGDAGTGDVTVFSENDSDSRNVTVNEPPFFNVTIDSVEDSVTAGDTVTVEYTVENTGDLQDTQDIVFKVNGSQETVESDVTLDGGNTFSDQFTYTTDSSDTPAIEAAISSDNDTASAVVSVEEPPFFDVEITETNSPVVEGDDVEANVTVKNTGGLSDTQNISLKNFTDNTVDTNTSVQLAPGESTNFNLTWSTSDGDAGSGRINATSEDSFDTAPVTINTATGFEVSRATDITPFATQQQQTFRFSLTNGNGLDGGETVKVTLDDPHKLDQNDNPIQVSYTSENFQVIEGPGIVSNINTGNEDASFTYKAPDSDGLAPDEDVVIWAKEVKVGDLADQNESYTVRFNRSDTASFASPTFSVDRDGRSANLTTFKIENLSGTRQQDFNITFEPANGGFEPNEWVTVELVDAADDIDFSSENQALIEGQGDTDYKATTPRVRYQAPNSGFDGTVTIQLQDVEPTQENVEYVASASRGTAGTVDTNFSVKESSSFAVTIDNVGDEVTEGEDVTVEYTIENTGGVEDTQDIDSRTESDVTLDNGETFSGLFTYTTEDAIDVLHTTEVVGFLALGVGHCDHPPTEAPSRPRGRSRFVRSTSGR